MSFSLKCNECGNYITLRDNKELKSILISSTINFSSEKNITCQACGHNVKVE